MKIRVDNGKYTFVQNSYKVDVLRHGEPWIQDLYGANAVLSLMAELDAARVVVAEARILVAAHDADGTKPDVEDIRAALRLHESLAAALRLHESLVSDHEPPSEWAKITPF